MAATPVTARLLVEPWQQHSTMDCEEDTRMTPVTQADKDRIERFLQQDLTNGLAEEHLWRLVADVRAEAYEAAAKVAESAGTPLTIFGTPGFEIADRIRVLATK